MAEPQETPDEAPKTTPAAKKAAVKKAPAKKAPVKKAAATQAALKAGTVPPALASPAPRPALTASTHDAEGDDHPMRDSFGRGHRIPLSLGLAVAGLLAIALSRLRRD
jgi:hypothetical protein